MFNDYNIGRHRQELLDRIKSLDMQVTPSIVQQITKAKTILGVPAAPAPAPVPELMKNEELIIKNEPEEITSHKPQATSHKPRKIIYGADGILYLGGDVVPMRYAIVELDDIITSNDPFTFSTNPAYPVECQNRSYKDDKNEQSKILRNEKSYDPTFVIVPSPDGVNGPPVISPDMVVLGGNSRAMTQKRLKHFNPNYHKIYTDYLRTKSDCDFNIPTSDIDSFTNPALVRIIDVDMQKCSRYSNLLQKGQTEVFDHVRQGLAYGSQLMEDRSVFKELAKVFEESDGTIAATMGSNDYRRRILHILRKAELLRDDNRGEWLETNSDEFSDIGKLLMSSMLLSTVLDERKHIESVSSYSNDIAANIAWWLQVNDLPGDWNLIPPLKQVIEQENKRRKGGGVNKNALEVISQTSMYEQAIPAVVAYLWLILEWTPPEGSKVKRRTVQKELLKSFLDTAHNETSDGNIFETLIPKARPIDVLREYASKYLTKQEATQLDTYYKANALSGLGLANFPTAKQIIQAKYNEKPLKLERTEKLFGNLLDNAKVFVYGNPGNGKSTFVLMLADDLALNGKVLYVMTEEKIGARFQERLKWKKIYSKNIHFMQSADMEEIMKAISSGAFKFVIIDSHNKLNAKQDDVLKLMEMFPQMGFVFISRNLKDAKHYAGSGNWAFDVDTVVKLENGVAILEKKHRDRTDSQGTRTMKVVNYS